MLKRIPSNNSWRLAASALSLTILAACGGSGGDGSTTSSNSGGSSVTGFPTGVTVSSPAALDSSSNVVASAAQEVPWQIRASDWSRTMWAALRTGDTHTAGTLLTRLLPLSTAWATPSKTPEGAVMASEIEAVAKGTLPLSHGGLLNMGELFNVNSVNTACFGPTVQYANHNDGAGGSGSLPSGDLGLWLADNTDGSGTQPCATAKLNDQLGGTKKQVRQAMLLMAGIRRLIAASSTLSMPAANATTDVQSELASELSTAAPSVTVDAATVSLNSIGTVYTYRLALSAGSGATAKQGEIVIQHTPGASATQFSGVLQITAAQLGTDGAFGCNDEVDGGTSRYKVATVSTIRYDKNGTALDVGARKANYCGAPAPSSTSYIDDIAALDSDGMLDLSVHLNGGNARSSVKGWRGNASRFGATMNTATQAGDFTYLWQAGNMDDHSRAFAVHSTYNSGTETRTLDAYYAYAQAIHLTNGDLQGMICNWAGPGNSHTPVNRFQYQQATLTSSASIWTGTVSHITYAPTVSCSSTGSMTFDVDASGAIAGGEGQNVTHDLPGLTGSNTTVADELSSLGYVKPTLF